VFVDTFTKTASRGINGTRNFTRNGSARRAWTSRARATLMIMAENDAVLPRRPTHGKAGAGSREYWCGHAAIGTQQEKPEEVSAKLIELA